MKTRKFILLIVFIIGVLGLWLMSSFANRNACEYATSNIEYIQEQIEAALTANNFEKSKYFAFKALNGIEKTRSNFLDCGCDGTIASLENALSELKTATKAPSFHASKRFLYNAMENTIIGIKVLGVFEQELSSSNNMDILLMNTMEALENHHSMHVLQAGPLHHKEHNCLLSFQSSLNKVVTDVECTEAFGFITKIYDDATLTLLDPELSEAKKKYHQRVREIAKDALSRLGSCEKEE